MNDNGPGPVLALALGALLVALAWMTDWVIRKAARGEIGVNGAVGLRTTRLMVSTEAWRAGHGAAAKWTRIAAGAVTGVGVLSVIVSMSTLLYLLALALMLAALIGGVVVGTIHAGSAVGGSA